VAEVVKHLPSPEFKHQYSLKITNMPHTKWHEYSLASVSFLCLPFLYLYAFVDLSKGRQQENTMHKKGSFVG
jgi:hypothetical protein